MRRLFRVLLLLLLAQGMLAVSATAQTLPGPSPVGVVDAGGWNGTKVAMSGWAFDRDALNAGEPIRVYRSTTSGPVLVALTSTTVLRSDVNANFGITGTHGWQTSFQHPSGTFVFCVYAINSGSGQNTRIGCKTVTVPVAYAPVGHVEVAKEVFGQGSSGFVLSLSGWAFDRNDLTHPETIDLYLCAPPYKPYARFLARTTTTTLRSDVNKAYNITGSHGWAVQVEAPVGKVHVCVYAINIGAAAPNTNIGTNTVASATVSRIWGSNKAGRLGDETTTDRSRPTPGFAPAGVVQALADYSDTVMLTSSGTVWVVGTGPYGEFGRGVMDDQSSDPVRVPGLTDITKIALTVDTYGTVVALRSDGTVWAWGSNIHGQVGDGTTTDADLPKKVSSLDHVIDIGVDGEQLFAVKSDGTVWCWGPGLGQATTAVHQLYTPPGTYVEAAGGWLLNANHELVYNSDATVVMSGVSHIIGRANGVFAIKSDGTLWAWGPNAYGRLGVGDTADHPGPQQVKIPGTVVAVADGGTDIVALDSTGNVYAWGDQSSGAVGNGVTAANTIEPTPTKVLTGAHAIGAGSYSGFAFLN